MPRGLSSPFKAHIAASGIQPLYFVSIALSTPLYLWNGVGSTTQNDSGGTPRTWVGVGDAGIIDGLENDRSLRSSEITIGLVGIPSDAVPSSAIAATRSERYQGKALEIYICAASPATGLPLFTPELIWSGYADVISLSLGSEVRVFLTAEHRTSHLRRINGYRMTTVSHNSRLGGTSPHDLFFEPQDRLMGQPKPLLSA